MNELDAQFAVEVGHRIRRRRLAEGMTQKELSMRADLHRSTIISIEKGRSALYVSTMILIAGGLGVSLDEILGGVEWVPAPSFPSGRWQVRPATTGPGS